MNGSVHLRTDVKSPYWIVCWRHDCKLYKIPRYLGESEVMHQTHKNKRHDIGYQKATKLLHMMQGDVERKVLKIEKYTGEQYTDVIPYLEQWLEDRRPNLTPAGYEKYKIAVNKHLIPFFKENNYMLHEIKYDTLVHLMNFIEGSGKHKKNIVDTLRCCLRYAWKSERIQSLPPFPEKSLYNIPDKSPEWIPTDRFYNIMQHIPTEHKPFFMWLYLHLRRPGEAMALLKKDYKKDIDAFEIHRGISACKIIERTKDGDVHLIPCHEEFKPFLEQSLKNNPFSPFLFTHESSKSEGKRYTGKFYRTIWDLACEKENETIDVYRGTKTSRASQLVNEAGISSSDLQIAGDWASSLSVKSYAKANIAKKKSILERKIIPITKYGNKTGTEKK